MADWLATAEAGNLTELAQYCGYYPSNMQSRVLGLPAGAPLADGLVSADTVSTSMVKSDTIDVALNGALEVALAAVEDAYFVGTLEQYAASLCLLNHRANGEHPSCRCVAAEAAPPKVNHETKGTHTEKIRLTDSERLAIERLTTFDAKLYAAAAARLERELRAAHLECLLDPSRVNRTLWERALAEEQAWDGVAVGDG